MVEVANVLNGTLCDEAHLRQAFGVLAPLYQRRFDPAQAGPDRTVLNVEMLNWFFSVGVKDYDVRDRLGKIAVPVLVLTGRHDWICPPSQSEALVWGLPDVRQVVFEESGHRLMREERRRFLDCVSEFALTGEVRGATRGEGSR